MSSDLPIAGDRGDRARIFTLQEANDLIPWVRTRLEQLVDDRRSLDRVQSSLASLTPQMRGNGHRSDALALEVELERLMESVADGINAFIEAGIQLKDIEAGIIDFPARHRGRIVLLCWRLGENAIEFWHEMNSGFAGRRPISEFNV